MTPGRTDVRPGGASGSSCDGAAGEALPPSSAATQNAVLHFEETHDLVVHGMGTSLVFFHEPNHDTVIEPLPTTFGPDRPIRYDPILASEYLAAKMDALEVR